MNNQDFGFDSELLLESQLVSTSDGWSKQWFVAFAGVLLRALAFPLFIVAAVSVTHYTGGIFLARYDLLLLLCVSFQLAAFLSGSGSRRSLIAMFGFLLLGICLEYKRVWLGSWSYPEFAYSKIAGVPLYSGFMYASVASFLCSLWRQCHIRLIGSPHVASLLASTAIMFGATYLRVGTNTRLWILIALCLLYANVRMRIDCNGVQKNIPYAIIALLLGLAIYCAENIVTFFGAWQYSHQSGSWSMVHVNVLVAWMLMATVSLNITAISQRAVRARSLTGDS